MSRELGRRIAGLAEWEPQEPPGRPDAGRSDASAPPAETLSFGEERMWFLQRLEPAGHTYNLHACVLLTGAIDSETLAAAVRETARRQAALRTSYPDVDGRPVRRVAGEADLTLDVVDLREAEPERLEALLIEQAQTPFELGRGPLARVSLLRIGDKQSVLSLTAHHVISDGWSQRVFFSETFGHYSVLLRSSGTAFPPLRMQYSDFAARQRESVEGAAGAESLEYWTQRLSGAPVLDLPGDRQRPPAQSYRGGRVDVALSRSRLEKLRELGRSEQATVFMSLLAAFQTLLYRHSGQPDVAVGSPVSNRSMDGAEEVIGYFGNTLALRTDLSGGPSFREAVRRTRRTALEGFARQEIPFERIVQEISPARSRAYNPVFQAMLVLNEPWQAPPAGSIQASPQPSRVAVALCDLTLSVVETDAGLSGFLEYAADLFDRETAERLARRWETLIASALADPDRSIDDLEILPKSERRLLLQTWNATRRDYPDKLLHQLVDEQAEKTPDAVAVRAEGRSLSYRDLALRSSAAAVRLHRRGFGRSDIAGLGLPRNEEALVWMLGVLKAGGAYVPLDPAYPADRISFMLADSGAKALVVSRSWAPSSVPPGVETIVVEEEDPVAEAPAAVPEGTSSDLAYVIYTSGSTGKPKGVAIEHRSAVALAHWALDEYSADELSVVAACTSFCFDLSVYEIYVTLAAGGTVFLAPDLLHLAETPGADAVTLVNTVPSVLASLLQSRKLPSRTRTVNLAGEPLTQDLVRRIYLSTTVDRVVDLYGPSEDTTYSTFAERKPAAPQTIGRPIANTRVYIVDERLRPVPIGVPGELCLAGSGLARGYLGRPELTAERFVPDPFDQAPGGRLYRTGDLARYRGDGRIEFIGRSDGQVKVRGFRVELGEIESVLREDACVASAAAVARPGPGGSKILVAFLQPEAGAEINVETVRAGLARKLPDYMVPSRIAVVDRLPVSPNGKIDRKALAEIEAAPLPAEEYVAPRTDTERKLAAIWTDRLGLDRVGVRDDFFQLGGHSLLAIEVFARTADEFGSELSLADLFDHPTIEGLARRIDGDAPPPQPSALIAIRPEGSLPPLFCLHADSGLALFYRDLAGRIGDEQPIFAFQSIGLDGSEEPLESIDEMAERYLAEMRRVQPRGPYYLAGFCMGAYIGQEMARRLELEGETVAFLASFNTDGEWRSAESVEQGLDFHRENLARLPAAKRVAYVIERIVYRAMRVGYGTAMAVQAMWQRASNRLPVALRMLELQETNRRANREFRVRPYSGKVVFFQGDQDAFRDPHAFWDQAALGGVEVVPVKGKEISILLEPNVAGLAEELRTRLAAARREAGQA